jgi:hypothetical protein
MKVNKTLFTIHLAEFILFFVISISFFSLPSLNEFLQSGSNDFDLFYKILFRKFVDILIEEYITLGSLFLVLSFLGLFATLITHANLRKLFYINFIYSIVLIFIIPLGTIFAFLTFPSLWNARSSDYDVDEEINIPKEKKKKNRVNLKLKLPNFPIRKNLNKESDMIT